MFYPEAFPEGTPMLTAAETLQIEFDAMCLLLQADRTVLGGLTAGDLAGALMEHLEFGGTVTEENQAGARDLLQRNAGALGMFVTQRLLPDPTPGVLRWLEPDLAAVAAQFGPPAGEEWRERAEQEAHSVTGERVAEQLRVPA